MNDDRGFQLPNLATLQFVGDERLVMLNRADFVHIWAQQAKAARGLQWGASSPVASPRIPKALTLRDCLHSLNPGKYPNKTPRRPTKQFSHHQTTNFLSPPLQLSTTSMLNTRNLVRVIPRAVPLATVPHQNFHTTTATMVKVGDSIPSLDLVEGTPGSKVNLAQELKGKGLIIGVPAAFSK